MVIYTLSLHDALPILVRVARALAPAERGGVTVEPQGNVLTGGVDIALWLDGDAASRSEEHTSELQSHVKLVCRLLREKKKCRWIRSSTFSSSRTTQLP